MLTDLFAELLPLNVRHALSAYENRRNELVNYEISNLREMTQLLNRYISRNMMQFLSSSRDSSLNIFIRTAFWQV